jgi:hypothetical protein
MCQILYRLTLVVDIYIVASVLAPGHQMMKTLIFLSLIDIIPQFVGGLACSNLLAAVMLHHALNFCQAPQQMRFGVYAAQAAETLIL